MSIESVMPSNHLILCHPLLLLPSIFPSIRVFSNESVPCIRWPKYWSFSFSISPSNDYSGLISFRIDWFDLLAVQGTLKSLLQHHSLEVSIIWPPDMKNWLIWKDPDAGKDWRRVEKGTTEDEMVGWHHRLNGHKDEQAPGAGDGQGSLACCSPWCSKESGMTEWLNWVELNQDILFKNISILFRVQI